jgi:UDP-apiose/xylose synthase
MSILLPHKNILVLGASGFIGSHLVTRLLADTSCHITGIDVSVAKVGEHLSDSRFTYINLDIYEADKVRAFIQNADVVVSLAALCNPSLYNTTPLAVIESNFTRPLDIVQMCTAEKKWLIHYSTCEVYGKTIAHVSNATEHTPQNSLLSEYTTPLIMGAVSAQRWCYASAKQLLERAVYAYGFERGLKYTIVRPFNFVGPRMDYIPGVDGEGVPRVIACFMDALLRGEPLKLVDGGSNKRTFTSIHDAIDALMLILANPTQSHNEIFNVANPANELSVAELAAKMIECYDAIRTLDMPASVGVVNVSAEEFYGLGYEDSDRRLADITNAKTKLGWNPSVGIRSALMETVAWYIDHYASVIVEKKVVHGR